MRFYKPACDERATTSSRSDAQASGRPAHAARTAASRPLRSPRSNEAVLKSGHEQGRRFRRQWRNRRSDGQLGALPRSAHWETVLLAKASCRILSKGTSVGFGLTTVEIRKSACYSAPGPNADRRRNLLIGFTLVGSTFRAYSHRGLHVSYDPTK